MNGDFVDIFCFIIGDIRLAIPLTAVVKVIRAVEVTPVPNAPKIFHGLINYHSNIIPVINLRHRFNLVETDIIPEQVYLITKTKERMIALVADKAEGVVVSKRENIFSSEFLKQSVESTGITLTTDGMLFIYDIEKFIEVNEIVQFDKAIEIEDNQSL
jgi:purine-binding chemotaxis protein CheW